MLWRRVNRGLSAGRVQSPSIRLIVERERERIAFVAGRLLGHRAAHRDRAGVHRHARRASTAPRSPPARTSTTDGDVVGQGVVVARRGPGPRRSPTASPTCRLHGPLRRGEAVPLVAEGAVHDLDAAAGGRPQAAAVGVAGDARRAGPVRARLHHLHAYRQRRALRRGAAAPCAPRSPASTASSSCRPSPQQYSSKVEERPGGPRGDPADDAAALAPTGRAAS